MSSVKQLQCLTNVGLHCTCNCRNDVDALSACSFTHLRQTSERKNIRNIFLVERVYYGRWRKYSELVLCKSRGNSGVTASTSRMETAGNLQCGDDSTLRDLRANVTRDSGSPCPGAIGASVWGVGVAGYRFLCT